MLHNQFFDYINLSDFIDVYKFYNSILSKNYTTNIFTILSINSKFLYRLYNVYKIQYLF